MVRGSAVLASTASPVEDMVTDMANHFVEVEIGRGGGAGTAAGRAAAGGASDERARVAGAGPRTAVHRPGSR